MHGASGLKGKALSYVLQTRTNYKRERIVAGLVVWLRRRMLPSSPVPAI